MSAKICAIAAAALLLISAPGRTERAAKTVANEQAFYETLTFGPPLRSAELYAALDRVATSTTEQSFAARYFKGRQEWPAACTGLFTGLGGYEVELTFNGKNTEGDGRGYFVMLAREGRLGDFGLLAAKDDHISVRWYHCGAEVSHSLHATADAKHYLLKVAGQRMLAWSIAN